MTQKAGLFEYFTEYDFLAVKAALEPLEFTKHGMPWVNPNTQQSSEPWVFLGGDVAGVAETTVVSELNEKLFFKPISIEGIRERWEDSGLAHASILAIVARAPSPVGTRTAPFPYAN